MRVLFIEDNPDDVDLVGMALRGARRRVELSAAGTLREGLAAIADAPPDAVLLDLNLPDSRGAATFQRLRAEHPDLPVVVLTVVGDLGFGDDLVRQGAQDMLPKEGLRPEALAAALARAFERHRVLAALARSEARLRRLLDLHADAHVVVAGDGAVRFRNPAAEHLLGASAAEGARFPFHLAAEGEDAEATGSDGVHRPVEVRAIPIAWEDEPATLAVVRDVTARRRAEEALRRLASVVQASPDAILTLSAKGTVLTWNPAAERLFGIPAVDAVGRPASVVVPPDLAAEEDALLAKVLVGERVENLESLRLRSDGKVLSVLLSASPLRDATGSIAGITETVRDITERRVAEEARRLAAERLAMLERAELRHRGEELARLRALDAWKTRFLHVIAHELKTPLTTLRLWARMLLDHPRGELPRDLDEGLAVVERTTEGLAVLAADLTDVATLEGSQDLAMRRVRADLGAVVEAAAAAYRLPAERAGVALATGIEAGLVAEVDPWRITQVLHNLLSNALRACKPGCRIDVAAARDGEVARVEVRDDGAGIRGEDSAKLFQAFHRGGGQGAGPGPGAGAGLGLYISRGIVAQHGGAMTCASAGPGKGATFAFTLPLSPEPAEAAGPGEGGRGR